MTRVNKLLLAGTFFCVALTTSCTDENSNPSNDDRDAFTGSWTCAETSKQFGNSTYAVTISSTGEIDSVSIKNFYQLGNGVSAIALVSGNSITIPFQDVSGGIEIHGTGLMNSNSNKIDFTYYADDAGVIDTVTATYNK